MCAYAMKRVAASAHLPTPWLFEPAKSPDDRADYVMESHRAVCLSVFEQTVVSLSLWSLCFLVSMLFDEK